MADVPAVVQYGKVVGRFVSFIADSDDPGAVPDEVPLTGSITITANAPLMRFATTNPPRTAVIATLECPVIAGDLYAPHSSTPGVWMIASDQPAGTPNHIQFTARFNFAELDSMNQPSPVVFEVPVNGEIDLALALGVNPDPGTVVVVSSEGVVRVEQIYQDIQDIIQGGGIIMGEDGREVELRNSGTAIEWRYTGDTTWSELIPNAELVGPEGPKGDQGDPGSPGDKLTMGTVTTGAPGSEAMASISGNSPNRVLDLTIPRGSQGLPGSPGDQLSIGTVTTLDTGTPATATISGVSPNRVLNLGLPRGAQGASPPALSALTVALATEGTDTEVRSVSPKVFKDSVDALSKPNYTRCTSTTRPSNPSQGDRIYEMDTRASGVYDSSLGWLMTDSVWQTAPLLASLGNGSFITWNSSQTLNRYMRAGKRLHVEFGFNVAADANAGNNTGAGRLHVSLPAGLQMASYQYAAPWATYITLGMARARKVSTSADTPVHIAPAGPGFVDFVNPSVEWVDLSGWWGIGMYVMGTYTLELA